MYIWYCYILFYYSRVDLRASADSELGPMVNRALILARRGRDSVILRNVTRGKPVSGQQTTLLIDDRPGSRQSIAHMLAARTFNRIVTSAASLEQGGNIAPPLALWHVHGQRSDAPNVASQIDGPRMRFGDIPHVVICDLDDSNLRWRRCGGSSAAICRPGFAPT
jgi:hypothetical protein